MQLQPFLPSKQFFLISPHFHSWNGIGMNFPVPVELPKYSSLKSWSDLSENSLESLLRNTRREQLQKHPCGITNWECASLRKILYPFIPIDPLFPYSLLWSAEELQKAEELSVLVLWKNWWENGLWSFDLLWKWSFIPSSHHTAWASGLFNTEWLPSCESSALMCPGQTRELEGKNKGTGKRKTPPELPAPLPGAAVVESGREKIHLPAKFWLSLFPSLSAKPNQINLKLLKLGKHWDVPARITLDNPNTPHY